MLDLAEEVTGRKALPGFSENVIQDEEAGCCMCLLHEMVMTGTGGFGKEEPLWFLIKILNQRWGHPNEKFIPECWR